MNPYAAHCYVLNGETARRLIEKIPKEKWKRPHVARRVETNPRLRTVRFFPINCYSKQQSQRNAANCGKLPCHTKRGFGLWKAWHSR